MRKRVAHEQALWYEEELNKEIEKIVWHMEKAIEEKDDNQPPASGGTGNDKDSISEELPEDVKHKMQHQRSGKWMVSKG